jgi:hypothetical protein
MVDNFLHRINPSAQRSTHQNPQGMTENHQENIGLGHPWVFGKYCNYIISLLPNVKLLVTSYDSCKGNFWK